MAFPVDGLLTQTPRPAGFLPPWNRLKERLEDWSPGGVAINDATRGLNLYHWHGFVEGNEFWLGVPNVVSYALHYTFSVTPKEVSFSFDTNMQPVIGWTDKNGDSWFRWFDPTIPDFAVIALPEGTRTVRVSLDDAREAQAVNGVTDTIITYLVGGSLYYRQLRDRFAVEYQLATGYENWELGQFGMNRNWRMQWQLVPKPLGT